MEFSIRNTIFLFALLAQLLAEFHMGHCKTLHINQSNNPIAETKGRQLESFVEFTGEGDQLAVESSRLLSSQQQSAEGKREILGKGKSSCSNAVVGCSDFGFVTKVLYPVIPVIVAAITAIILSILIANLFRTIYRVKGHKQEHDDLDPGYGYETSGYSDDEPGYRLLGFNLKNVNYTRLLQNVLTAIDKIY